jgi:N-methylhydantoinase B
MNFRQNPTDVYAVMWSAGGGFGDPFERDPRHVADDFEARAVSREAALDIYGVLLDVHGQADLAATEALRAKRRLARVKTEKKPPRISGDPLALLTDNLALKRRRGKVHVCCAKCSADLGSVRANYKDRCLMEEQDVSAANPHIGDYRRYIDEQPVWRQFFCPGCGTLIENEVARAGDPVLADIEVIWPA